jgi:hypothetical protein
MENKFSLREIFNFSSEELGEKLFFYDSFEINLNITYKRINFLMICYRFSLFSDSDDKFFHSKEKLDKFIENIKISDMIEKFSNNHCI